MDLQHCSFTAGLAKWSEVRISKYSKCTKQFDKVLDMHLVLQLKGKLYMQSESINESMTEWINPSIHPRNQKKPTMLFDNDDLHEKVSRLRQVHLGS